MKDEAKKDKKRKIALQLSDLIFYCTSCHWKDWDTSRSNGYQFMSSWGEKKAMKACGQESGDANNFILYNTRNFSRCYPKGTRVMSDNYNPQPAWNCGMQVRRVQHPLPFTPPNSWPTLPSSVRVRVNTILRPRQKPR